MADRIPFDDVAIGQRITFDNGHYMTGVIVKNVGRYGGKRMVEFLKDGDQRARVLSYACHRSVRCG